MLIPKASHLVERVAERLLRSGALNDTAAQLLQPGGAPKPAAEAQASDAAGPDDPQPAPAAATPPPAAGSASPQPAASTGPQPAASPGLPGANDAASASAAGLGARAGAG